MTPPRPITLVPILGDQLSASLASLRGRDPAASVVLMAEVMAECTYVRHHKRKIALVLSVGISLVLFAVLFGLIFAQEVFP